MILFCFVLFLIFSGCKPGEHVTVSGAVDRPGMIDFQPGNSGEAYLKLAGGVTEEGLAGDAYVVRGVPDSSDAELIRSVKVLLSEEPEILVNDEIHVPSKVYDVRLDTARVLHDVRLVQDEQLFKLDKGALVSGWTEHGVLVALLLGRGTVHEEADTINAISAFHYLYVHLHPDEYKRLGSPGAGVRRRRFADGRIWTTFPGRRQRWQYPDGRVVVAFPGGAREVRFSDGRVEYTDSQGNVRTTFADGSEHWKLALGTEIERLANGHVTRRYTTGDVVERLPDNTKRIQFASGKVRTEQPDGVVEIIDGKVTETHYPDGRREVITEEGHKITLMADGQQVSQLADGSVVRYGPDGSVVKEHASGIVTRLTADGKRLDVMPDGTTMTQDKDGVRVVRYVQGDVLTIQPDGYMLMKSADGSVQVTFTDGRILRKDPSGHQLEILPDGTRVESNAFGQKITRWPNGQLEVRMPSAYAYPGNLHTGLAMVNPLPEAIPVGDELMVSGLLKGKVDQVSVTAFLAPDGDVIFGNVRQQGRKFHAKFKFGESGHCRVQVQVVLPKARTFTVSHQAVVVGAPKKLNDVVLNVRDYPGDEAAELFLISRINQDRKKSNARRYILIPI